MPLGLIAKDSIQDLTSLGEERRSTSRRVSQPSPVTAGLIKTSSNKIQYENSRGVDNIHDNERPVLGLSYDASNANPQQAPLVPYSGFRYDFSDYSYEYYDATQHTNQIHSKARSVSSEHRLGYGNGANAPIKSSSDSTSLTKEEPWKPNLLCCFFPWLGNNQDYSSRSPLLDADFTGSTNDNESLDESESHIREIKIENEGDEADSGSTSSHNKLGEKLSARERQAVLARLRLASPESSNSLIESEKSISSAGAAGPGHSSDHPGSDVALTATNSSLSSQPRNCVLNGIPVVDRSPLMEIGQPRGILKRKSLNNTDSIIIMKNGVITACGSNIKMLERGNSLLHDPALDDSRTSVNPRSTQRRSLFPNYEKSSRKPRENIKPVRFSPMARVIAVTSRHDMTPEEKADIWWQRSDYEDFRRTGRIITRAMLEGGSEIWLGSSASTSPTNPKAENKVSVISKSNEDKWWHKFGHSRRGLEHVVSVDEGKQRQNNVRSAIRAVLDEQARQTMYRRGSSIPNSNISLEEKLRNVSLHHTQWARDLALAAGASDADAVESSFAEDRRSREFYLLKLAKNNTSSQLSGMTNSVNIDISNKSNHHLVPQFMLPTMQAARDATRQMQQRLDANTTAQIRFRTTQNKLSNDGTKITKVDLQSQLSTRPSAISNTSISKKVLDPEKTKLMPTVSKPLENNNSSSEDSKTDKENTTNDEDIIKCEPLNDDTNGGDKPPTVTLAQKAAGFSAVDDEKVNMAAVLSGMGIL